MIYKENCDITTVTRGIIAHGVNRQLAMGSGVAKSILTKWPKVYQQYMSMSNPIPKLGVVDEVIIDRDFLSIMNCYTQEYYGRDGRVYADYDAVFDSMLYVAELADLYGVYNIHIPKIGCGLGGLKWNNIGRELIAIEKENLVEFVVYTL